MDQRPNTTKTGDLGLVAFLSLREILPVDWTKDEFGHGSLYYEETAELHDAMVDYQKECPSCRFAPSQFTRAQARARRMLFDGEICRKR